MAAAAGSDVPQQHRELVAAETRHDVRRAHAAHQRRRDRLEDGVARGMAVTVVHRLEIVEVEIDQRRAGAIALDVSQRAFELALEAAAVEDIGERIDVDARFKLGNPGARDFEFRRKRVDFRGEPGEAERDGGRDGCGRSGSPGSRVCRRSGFDRGRAIGLRPGFAALFFMQEIPAAKSPGEHSAAA